MKSTVIGMVYHGAKPFKDVQQEQRIALQLNFA